MIIPSKWWKRALLLPRWLCWSICSHHLKNNAKCYVRSLRNWFVCYCVLLCFQQYNDTIVPHSNIISNKKHHDQQQQQLGCVRWYPSSLVAQGTEYVMPQHSKQSFIMHASLIAYVYAIVSVWNVAKCWVLIVWWKFLPAGAGVKKKQESATLRTYEYVWTSLF